MLVFLSVQDLKRKKQREGKLDPKSDMSAKEREAFDAQLEKEAEIRQRLQKVTSDCCNDPTILLPYKFVIKEPFLRTPKGTPCEPYRSHVEARPRKGKRPAIGIPLLECAPLTGAVFCIVGLWSNRCSPLSLSTSPLSVSVSIFPLSEEASLHALFISSSTSNLFRLHRSWRQRLRQTAQPCPATPPRFYRLC